MPLDGALYTVADYVPCFNCTDVRLVEQVFIAELTDDVRAAIAAGRLPDPPCEVCGLPLYGGQPLLLSSPGPELSVWHAPSSAELNMAVAGWLLGILKDRRASWPAEDPAELRVVPRDDLTRAPLDYAIPPEVWDHPSPSTLPTPGREHQRGAWDALLDWQRDVTASAPAGMKAELAGKLARACIRSFQALGDPVALTEARTASAQALTAASSPGDRARALTLQGTVAVLEHERRGEAELAREAVVAFRAALELDPGDSVAASGLGSALGLLQSWDGDAAARDEGIETLRRAVAKGGNRAVRLNNLGGALSARWEVTHASRDLAEAAVALAEAVELTPPASPDLAARLNNLGTVHARAGALTAAVDAFDAAVDATVTGDPDLPGRRANVAAALWRRSAPGDAARATNLSREAAAGHADDPADALRAACNWGRNAFRLEAWAGVTEAYEYVLTISDLLLERQLTGEARRARLREVQGLPDLAAFAHAKLGDGAAAAHALDAGRARLLADALELVAAGVETADPALAARRELVVRDVERAERAIEDADGERRVELAAAARRLREELAGVMAEIAPAPADPAVAPLVSVACTPAGTVASVGTELVWAPGLTSAEVERLATLDVEAALDTLGAELAGPLAPLLAGHDVVTFSLPAALARLPLAAAPFTVRGAVRRLIDDHATALLPAAAAAPAAAAPRLGGVANPARAGLPPLQCAASELSTAAAHLPAEAADVLVGADATVERLLTTLGRCSHLHLACHGEFRADDPLASRLLLADGDLSLRRMQRVDRPAELSLLVLSACESAQSDTEVLPDELIGLPTAFLQLGARAVVGALWPIPDLPTCLLMGRFYLHLAEDEVAPAEALRRAQNWLRAAPSGELAAVLDGAGDPFVRRAADVIRGHFAPEARPFAAPSVWAAFVSFGASA